MLVENPFAATEKAERGILVLLQEHWQIFPLRTFKRVLLEDLTAGSQINCAVLEEKDKKVVFYIHEGEIYETEGKVL